jgi:hypothetical protein
MHSYIDSRFWQKMSLAASATLALSLTPAVFGQDAGQTPPQPTPTVNPGSMPASANPSSVPVQSSTGVDRRELQSFDDFLKNHPELAQRVEKDPSLLANKNFIESNPALKDFYNSHPGVEQQARSNPAGFVKDTHEWNHKRVEEQQHSLQSFDHFLNQNPNIREELQKDPSLATNSNYLHNNPQLKDYLENHPGVRESLTNHPEMFLTKEKNYNRRQSQKTPAGMASRGRGR